MPSSACDWSSDVCSSDRSEEHTSELQSRSDLVCRLLLEKKKNNHKRTWIYPRGNSTVQVDPRRGRTWASIRPPVASAINLPIAWQRPVPERAIDLERASS